MSTARALALDGADPGSGVSEAAGQRRLDLAHRNNPWKSAIDVGMIDGPALTSRLGERALAAWKVHVTSLQQLVVAGELLEEHAALLQSEQAQAVWLTAFIREWRGDRERKEKKD